MKSYFTIISMAALFLFANIITAQYCDLEFNPSGGTYEPGDQLDVNICFRDFSAGFPNYETADWNGTETSDDPSTALITVEGSDGNGVTVAVLGSNNTINSAYCINVKFTAGSQGNLIKITATAKGTVNGCERTQTQTYTLIPIKLESFDVKLQDDNTVVLDWVTLSEFNNDFFTLEMSVDGVNFEEIGKVKGGGDSRDRLEYQYKYKLDEKYLHNPFLYFRLKQTDFDGLFTYSDVLILPLGNDKNAFVLNNTYYDGKDIKMTVTSKDDNVLKFRMIDMNGNMILQKEINVIRGFNDIELPVTKISSGIYVIQLTGMSKQETKKIFIR